MLSDCGSLIEEEEELQKRVKKHIKIQIKFDQQPSLKGDCFITAVFHFESSKLSSTLSAAY